MTPEQREAVRKAARAELWRRRKVWPLLETYLDAHQIEDMRSFFVGGDAGAGRLPQEDWYDDISRQRGKSWKWTVAAVVWAHCHAGQQIKYLAQFGSSVRGIIDPTITTLIDDMPKEFHPRYVATRLKDGPSDAISHDKVDHKWFFPHQSKAASCIHAAGANNKHFRALRGPRAHWLIKDECGFYADFEDVETALNPMLITTGGPNVYATTPAESPAHPSEITCNSLRAAGRYVHRPIHGHPRRTPEEIDRLLRKEALKKGMDLAAFRRTTFYRREYLCMHVLEESRAVCPEWNAPLDDDNPERGYAWEDYVFQDAA